jgi:hypothetical protein
MLMGLALGGVPSNLTTPVIAPPLLADAEAPAFTTCRLETTIVNIRTVTAKTFFNFILNLKEAMPLEFS